MSVKKIENWIKNGRDWETGLQLFEEHGDNSILLDILRNSPGEDSREILKNELNEILDKKRPKVKPRFTILSEKKWNTLDDKVRQLVLEKNDVHSEIQRIRSLLFSYDVIKKDRGYYLDVNYKNFTDTKQAGEQAFRLLELCRRRKRLWADLDYYEQHGRLPNMEVKTKDITNPVQAYRRIRVLQSYLCRSPESLKCEQWQSEIDKLQIIVNESTGKK